MSQLEISATLYIKEGQLDTFKSIANRCVASVKTHDTGTLRYDWFFNNDESVCVVKEKYVSSESLMDHMANPGDVLGDLLATCDLKIEVCGNPSDEIRAALQGLDVTYYTLFAGL